MKEKTIHKEIFDICFIGVMLALAVVLSSFCQIKLFSDIRLDLSYMLIPVMCYVYGALTGMLFASGVALFNSLFFSAYGVSISWITANAIIGLVVGLILHYVKVKKTPIKITIDLTAIIISAVIGLLLVKTVIECNLYELPFDVKIVKNAVAFGSDTTLMLVGYLVMLPIVNKLMKKSKGLE